MTVPLVILAALSLWAWYAPNPIDPESGWFLKKWVKTPAQVIPPQTAPRYRSEARLVPMSDTAQAEEFGYSVLPLPQGAPASPAEPMPHQLALQQESRHTSLLGMGISLGASLLGVLLAWMLYLKSLGTASRIARALGPIYRFSLNRWYIDEIYEYVFEGTFLLMARGAAWFDEKIVDGVVNLAGGITVRFSRIVGWFDRLVIDGIVNLIGGITQFFGLLVRSVQTGRVQTYMAWTLAGIVVLFVVVQFVF